VAVLQHVISGRRSRFVRLRLIPPRRALRSVTSFIRDPRAVLQRLLGMVLLASAAFKAHQQLTDPPVGGNPWTGQWFTVAIVEGVLLLGVLLLVAQPRKFVWGLAIMCFAMFACFSTWKAAIGDDTCGCFGKLLINPWWTACFDFAVVIALWRWRPVRPHRRSLANHSRIRFWSTLAVFGLLSVAFGIAIASSSPKRVIDADERLSQGDVVVLEPAQWLGKPVPILRYIDVGAQLQSGRWIVLFYHQDCAKCQAVILDYEAIASQRNRSDVRVALVELPPFTAMNSKRPSGCLNGRLAPAYDWFMSAPGLIEIDDGIVRSVDLRVKPQERSG
jgi:hypothetical protein